MIDDIGSMERTTVMEAADLNKLIEYISQTPSKGQEEEEEENAGEEEEQAGKQVIPKRPAPEATDSEDRKTKKQRKKEKRKLEQAREQKKKRLQRSRNKKFEKLSTITKDVQARLDKSEVEAQKRKDTLHAKEVVSTKRLGRLEWVFLCAWGCFSLLTRFVLACLFLLLQIPATRY